MNTKITQVKTLTDSSALESLLCGSIARASLMLSWHPTQAYKPFKRISDGSSNPGLEGQDTVTLG